MEKYLAAAGTFEEDGKVLPKRWDIDPFPGRITCIINIASIPRLGKNTFVPPSVFFLRIRVSPGS